MTMTPEHRVTLKKLRQARRALERAKAQIKAVRVKYIMRPDVEIALLASQTDIAFALEATDPDDKGKA